MWIRIMSMLRDFTHRDIIGEGQVWQQLGREQEALWGAGAAGGAHELRENLSLVDGVHALVDLVDHAEGRHGDALHCEENQRDCTMAYLKNIN